jgi:hypothetical protein
MPSLLCSDLFIPRHPTNTSFGQNAFKILYSLFKMWGRESEEMGFREDAHKLDTLAESIKKAAVCLESRSGSANEKASVIWMNLPATTRGCHTCGCAYSIRMELLVRVADSSSSMNTHIKTQLSNALSFLDSDPEVKLVVEAHKVLEDSFVVADGWFRCGKREVCLKHRIQGGCCSFDLWQCHDFESFSSVPEEGVLRAAAEGV